MTWYKFNKEKKRIIAIDFDGVIHEYSKGWHNGKIYDKPTRGSKESLEKLRKKGFYLLIFSVRSNARTMEDGIVDNGQAKDIQDYLDKYKIPYDEIYTGAGKPMAELYIDDNAFRFEKDWNSHLDDILTMLED